MTPVITHIDRALHATGRIVHGIRSEQWALLTPCDGWDVRTTTNHLVAGMQAFPQLLAGGTVHEPAEVGHLGDAAASAYDAAAVEDRQAWARPGVLDGTVAFPFATLPASMAAVIHLTELVVHGLDLAVATAQTDTIDEPLADDLLELMHQLGGIDAFRAPGLFGPEIEADTDALPHRRLLAYVGRTA